MSEVNKKLTIEDLIRILGSTVKHDDENKAITFLSMLLTYTDQDQINIGFLAESSSGKSYIPLEISQYFPQEDVIKLGYASPTAFFYDHGTLMLRHGIPVNLDLKPDKAAIKEDLEIEKGNISKDEVEAVYKREMRKWRELLKGSYYLVDLRQKILIFLDMPHDLLLQRLRSLLSHDDQTITIKTTDRKEKWGLKTKTVVVRGFPTVIFCSAKFSLADQEKTRLLLLSPEISQEKLRESIILKIERESDREAFQKRLMADPERQMLIERVRRIKEAKISNIIIPEEYREFIYRKFQEDHKFLAPRHQRDISRLLALIKAHALLNFMHRKRVDNAIFVEKEDVEAGFQLYYAISEANEVGLSPEIYTICQKIKPYIPEQGITRNDFQKIYFKEYHKPLGQKRCQEILDILTSCGLLLEDLDQEDKRKKRYYLSGKFLPAGEGEYISIPDVYNALREQLKEPFYDHRAVQLIAQFRKCDLEDAKKVWQIFIDEGKVFQNSFGLWEWVK